ncbi:probable peptidoglycan muropeptide transporter SLC46 [Hetaerina americana]|uniref:probable peptidoglycan muropeptide transporter SLC46 n=1 Tax=Hetaerina americana TaxID=62018 RepID=UPI003A7F3A8E
MAGVGEGASAGVVAVLPAGGRLSLCRRVATFFRSATVEPVMVVHMTAAMLIQVVWQSFLLNMVCSEHAEQNKTVAGQNITPAVCHQLLTEVAEDDLDQAEAVIQIDAAKIQAWRSAVEFAILVPVVLLLGVWSDGTERSRANRRAVMLLSLLGRFLQASLLFVLSIIFHGGQPGSHGAAVRPSTLAALTVALPVALTGSCTAFDAAAYAHVVCQAPPQHHTFRLGMANGFWCLGTVVGFVISGFLFKAFGFSGVFGTAAALEMAAIVLTLCLVKEKQGPRVNSEAKYCYKCMDPREIMGPLKVTFRRRPNNSRRLIFLMLFCLVLSYGASCGRQSVMFLYTRYRFHWDEVEYGLYGMFLMVMEVIGSFIAMGLFSYYMQMADAIIGAMSCTSHLLSSTFYLFANTSWQMYVAPLVEMANGQVVVIPRAIITKLVKRNEQGRVNSLLGCMEALIPMIFEPIYNRLYSDTLASTFPQAFFLLSATLVLPPTVLFIYLYVRDRQQMKTKPVHDETNEPLKPNT